MMFRSRLPRMLALFLLVFMANSSVQAYDPVGFDLQGHRGTRGLEPENTLPAFKRALELGVMTLELDTGITADGIVVVIHDQQLNPAHTRDASGNWVSKNNRPAVHDLTLAELKTYEVGRVKRGSRYAERFPDVRERDNVRIPTLDEVFTWVKSTGNTVVKFNIETKINPEKPGQTLAPEAFVKALLAVIDKHHMRNRVSIQSFDWRSLQIAQRLAPNIPTVYLTARQSWLDNISPTPDGSPSLWTAGFDIRDFDNIPVMINAAGGSVWSPYHKEIDAEQLGAAHLSGLPVVVWTVNKQARMKALIKMGVDGIISDYPDRLVKTARDIGIIAK